MFVISVNTELVNQGLKRIFEEVADVGLVCQNQLDFSQLGPEETVYIVGLSKCEHHLIEQLGRIKQKCVILLDTKFDRIIINKLLRNSIHGFLSLDSDKEEILKCLHLCTKGVVHYPQQISKLFTSDSIKLSQFKLSERECEILELLSQGKTLQEISEDLFLSKNTVVTHKRNVLKKTGFNKMTQLVAWWRGSVA